MKEYTIRVTDDWAEAIEKLAVNDKPEELMLHAASLYLSDFVMDLMTKAGERTTAPDTNERRVQNGLILLYSKIQAGLIQGVKESFRKEIYSAGRDKMGEYLAKLEDADESA